MIEIIPNWHPVFVHFTVALLLMAALFYLIAFLPAGRWQGPLLSAARINLFTGTVVTVATVVAGVYAYNSVQHDDPSHLAMTDHRDWALFTSALWVLGAVWEGWRAMRGRGRSAFIAVALIAAAVLLGVTGFKGGELVFRYGLGVQSLPNIDTHAHLGGSEATHRHDDTHSHDEPPSGHSHGDALTDGQHPASPAVPVPQGKQKGATHVHSDGSSHAH